MALTNIIDNGTSVTVVENNQPITVGKNMIKVERGSGDYVIVTSTSGGIQVWRFNLTNDAISIDGVAFVGDLDALHLALEDVFFS